MYDEDVRHVRDLHDRNQIGERVVIQSFVQRRVHRDRADRIDDERVAVRRGADDEFGSNISASARFVVDDERLLESLR